MGITGNEIVDVKKSILVRWAMEGLGIAHCIVRIQLRRVSQFAYCISQPAIIDTVLACFGMTLCCVASTHFPAKLKLTRASGAEVTKFSATGHPYRRGVGSLIYLAICIQPDISFAVGVLSQHLEQPSQQHWDGFIHVLCYLKGTGHLTIHYRSSNKTINLSGNQS